MTVAELIAELKKYPSDYAVHLDMNDSYDNERLVRSVAGVRIQGGYKAVAIDGHKKLYKRDLCNDGTWTPPFTTKQRS